MTWTWVEPFAGAAACSLVLVGGRRWHLVPPVAWMGGKRRLAGAILGAMGVPEGRPSRVVLCDAGPWGWVWPLLLSLEGATRVADHLREWASEHPRALWERLAAQPPAEDLHERAAQWLWLQARSASGVPIWWDGWRLTVEGRGAPQSVWKRYGEDNAGRWRVGKTEGRSSTQTAWQKDGAWLASDGRGEPRPAGARAVGGRWEAPDHATGRVTPPGQTGRKHGGRWEKGHPDGSGAQDASRGQRGWRMGEEQKKSRRGTRTLSETGTTNGRTGGMVNPGTIAHRIEAIARAFASTSVEVHHGEAREILPRSGEVEGQVYPASAPATWVYLDPPYQGATGYGWDCPRAEVFALAQRWADAGAVVAVSEAVPLELAGWHHLDLTRPGGKPEWLTVSRAPVRVPERQLSLFDACP